MKKRGVSAAGPDLPNRRVVKGPALPWKRITAFFIDIIVIELAAVYPFRSLMQRIIPETGFRETYDFMLQNPHTANLVYAAAIMIAFIALLYFTILEYRGGQTAGKKLMGIYVESVKGDLRLWQVLVRNMWIIPFFPFIILWVIDPVYMLFTKDGRRISEIMSGTATVQAYQV